MDKNLKTGLIVGGIVLAVVMIVPAILGAIWGGGYGYGVMGPGMMGDFGWGWFMPVLMILFWGLVIWGIVALVRGTTSSGAIVSSREAESALEVLKKRYARGEISKEEFEEKKKDIV